jgi:hypothetical protein
MPHQIDNVGFVTVEIVHNADISLKPLLYTFRAGRTKFDCFNDQICEMQVKVTCDAFELFIRFFGKAVSEVLPDYFFAVSAYAE